jgi:hypothetical protein
MTSNRFKHLSLAAAAATCFTVSALAQTITAEVTGTVSDATGAVIPGAKVTATNVATNVATDTVTNSAGIYDIRFLQVGKYKITVVMNGFSTQTTEPFLLEVSQVAKVDTQLKPGATDTVTVSNQTAPILNTENGQVSTTISETLINDLPVNGHNFTELAQFTPGSSVADGNQWNGATGSPNNSGERVQSFATLPNINGNRTYTTNYNLDGISIVDTGANLSNGFGAPGYTPDAESLQEVTIISTVPPAEYGDGSTQIISITKSGSDTYHGSLSGYLQNWMMDANTFGNKRVLPGNTFAPRSHYTQAIYAGTIGGPVPFAHKRLFFFGDIELYRKPSASFSRINVPLNAWRGNTTLAAGSPDTSVSPLAGFAYFGSAVPQLYDSQNNFAPLNKTVNGVTYQNLVPINNPVATYLFAHPNFLPLPNVAPSAAPIQGNYQSTSKAYTHNTQYDVKVDYTPTDNDRISFKYTQGIADDGQTIQLTPISFAGLNKFPFYQGVIDYTRIISASTVNEFRAGYDRIGYNSYNQDISGQFSSGNSLVNIPYNNYAPGFSVQNFTESTNSTGVNSLGTAATGNLALDNQFSYSDNFTWLHGKHSSKFGAQLFRADNDYLQNNTGGILGGFSYTGDFTGDPAIKQTVGYDFADFLLDYATSYSVSVQSGTVGQRQYRFATFAQDDFHVTDKLNITYGLRWEYDQPVHEVHNKIANLNPVTGALQLAGQNGNSASLYAPTYNQFNPRFGFAYSINSKFVVRGGFGITTYMDYNLLHHTTNAPYHLSLSGSSVLPSTTSGGTPFAVTQGFGGHGAAPAGVSFTTWGALKPMFEPQFSLVTEYAIDNKQSVTVQYVGNIAQHLGDERNINQETLVGTPSSAAFDTTVVPTPQGNITIGTNAVELLETEAYSNFNAGEVTYRIRPAKGLEAQLNYTYSKSLGDTSGIVAVNDNNVAGQNPQNNFCLSCEYGPSASDSRHMFNSTFVYDLPVGKGKQFFGQMPTWLDEVVGGWKVSGDTVFFSGQPNTITANGSSGAVGAGTLRANHYRHMVITGRKDGYYQTTGSSSACGYDSGSGNASCTFVIAGAWGTDPSATHSGNVGAGTCGSAGTDDGICAYGQPALASKGQSPIFGTASVGSERAQSFFTADASVQKNWTLYHEHTLQFICEGYNVGNITGYNNEGRTVDGGSSWGYVQSSRSQQRQLELELKYKF